MDWTNETVLEFLNLYESEPVIWNPSHDLHKNRSDVHEAWKRIQEQLSIHGSITDLKKKKESLMASFRNCQYKYKMKQNTVTGTEDVCKPNWFAYKKMANFLKERDPPKTWLNSEGIASDLDSCGNKPIKIESDDSSAEDELLKTYENINSILPTPKKQKNGQDDKQHQKMDETLSNHKTGIQKEGKQKDECHIYGELIAAKLRKLDERTRDIAMNRIDNFLFQLKMNPSSMFSTLDQ